MAGAGEPSFAVVVPAHNAAKDIGECLSALIADGFDASVIVVVDDGSTDATAKIASEYQVVLLQSGPAGKPTGPAAARNLGVAATISDIVVFVDADVAVSTGTRANLVKAFTGTDAPEAVFGSYDASPKAPRLVSQYRNLLHHFTHQSAKTNATTFWTGLGAVHRSTFDKVDGFDPARRYLEDVTFGRAIIKAGGRIALKPEIQGKHLKDWTLGSMFWTDWKGRAVPWARMQARGEISEAALTSSHVHRANAAIVWLSIVGLMGTPFNVFGLWVLAVALVCFVGLNYRFFRLLFKQGGPALALTSVGYHAVHYVAATLGYLEVRLMKLANR